MFTCSTLLQFPYPVPADIHGSVQHVTLKGVPVDVLPRVFLWISQVKHFECRYIHSPQEVQCVHMYSVAGRSLLYQSLFDSVLIHNIATCLRMTFLCWGMCKVTPHFGCSSVADVYRYITA